MLELVSTWTIMQPFDGWRTKDIDEGGMLQAAWDGSRFGVLVRGLAVSPRRIGCARVEPVRLGSRPGDDAEFTWISFGHSAFMHVAAWLVGDLQQVQLFSAAILLEVLDEWARQIKMAWAIDGTGLAGELLWAKYLASIRGWDEVCSAYSGGSVMGAHDFDFDDISYEVKSTTANSGWRCEIHGKNQLKCTNSLYVPFFRLNVVRSGGFSIGDLLRGMPEDFLGDDTENIVSNLDGRWRLVECKLFPVNAGFPRIDDCLFIGGNCPHGVEDYSFRIVLDDAAGRLVDLGDACPASSGEML